MDNLGEERNSEASTDFPPLRVIGLYVEILSSSQLLGVESGFVIALKWLTPSLLLGLQGGASGVFGPALKSLIHSWENNFRDFLRVRLVSSPRQPQDEGSSRLPQQFDMSSPFRFRVS